MRRASFEGVTTAALNRGFFVSRVYICFHFIHSKCLVINKGGEFMSKRSVTQSRIAPEISFFPDPYCCL